MNRPASPPPARSGARTTTKGPRSGARRLRRPHRAGPFVAASVGAFALVTALLSAGIATAADAGFQISVNVQASPSPTPPDLAFTGTSIWPLVVAVTLFVLIGIAALLGARARGRSSAMAPAPRRSS